MSNEPLDRTNVIKTLLADPGPLLVVAGIGYSCSDVRAAGDRPLNFYVFGAMGAAAGIGLGLALAQPTRPVAVVTGDGELMMNVGVLATIAVQKPKNLSIVVLDNERFGATGFQKSHSAFGVDLAAMASASGFVDPMTVRNQEGVATLVRRAHQQQGPFFALVKVSSKPNTLPAGLMDGVELKIRFRRDLLGQGVQNAKG